ncbi:DNA-binding PadR family transcriptional regulator [Brevundimonas nasdae]|nr:PadR family transcriptional regulator [Brevundimonas nasdae]MDQ0451229.1 DNA-binding PadR family transcriptional regulator [Brevundimonas nasdae]
MTMRSKGIFTHHRRHEGGEHHGHGHFGHFMKRGMRGGGFGRGWERGEGDARGHGRRGGGRLFDHGTLRWLLLSLIAEKPSHGYELIKAVETKLGGAYSPSPGVIYPSLTLLEEMGALVSVTEGGKKQYSITDAGRVLLTENAEAIASVQATMAKFSAHALRPEAIQTAIGRLRNTIQGRLAGETALTEAQIEAMAAILNEAADRIEKA